MDNFHNEPSTLAVTVSEIGWRARLSSSAVSLHLCYEAYLIICMLAEIHRFLLSPSRLPFMDISFDSMLFLTTAKIIN